MTRGLVSLVTSLLLGAVAGWLAGKVMRGRGFGLLKNILLGILVTFALITEVTGV